MPLNPTSLEVWYPKIRWGEYTNIIPQPDTEIITFTHRDCVGLLDMVDVSTNPLLETRLDLIRRACERMGYPCFMRTAYYSAKFDGVCILDRWSEGKLIHLLAASYDEEKPVEAICIRKFIQSSGTHALRSGLPIGSERRYFIVDREVSQGYPYWTEESVNEGYGLPEWATPEYMASINKIHPEEETILMEYTHLIALSLGRDSHLGSVDWSVDYMKDKNGKWWLIDMGEAYKSWVPR